MKSFIYGVIAFLAASVAAIPAQAPPNSGELVSDLGPEVNRILTVTGTDSQELLVQLSPEVALLVSSLGLPTVGAPLGSVVATASNVGKLVNSIAPHTSGVVVVTGQDAGALLVQLSSPVAALVGGLLPPLAVPVGQIVKTIGSHVKRAHGTHHLLADVGKQVDGILTVAGPQASLLLIELSPEVAALLGGLGLGPVGVAAGSVVASASSVGALLTGLGPATDGLLIVVEQGASFLLVSLSPVLAGLLSGLGLPQLGVPVGTVVATIAANV